MLGVGGRLLFYKILPVNLFCVVQGVTAFLFLFVANLLSVLYSLCSTLCTLLQNLIDLPKHLFSEFSKIWINTLYTLRAIIQDSHSTFTRLTTFTIIHVITIFITGIREFFRTLRFILNPLTEQFVHKSMEALVLFINVHVAMWERVLLGWMETIRGILKDYQEFTLARDRERHRHVETMMVVIEGRKRETL